MRMPKYIQKEMDRLKEVGFVNTPVAVYQGYRIMENPVLGDEAPLMLMKGGKLIANDMFETSDYIDQIDAGKV